MKKLSILFFIISTSLLLTHYSFSQVNVTATVGTLSGSYTTLKAAFDAINAGTHKGVITIGISANTNEGTSKDSLIASGAGSAVYTSITISPTGGGSRTISGTTTAGQPLIILYGADNVTIDGLNTGGNSLTISNAQTSSNSGTSTLKFSNDASNNTITNCTILGSSTTAIGTNGGTVFFSTASGSGGTGNDNNTISYCNIGPAGANLPSKAIYGNGSTSSTTTYNSGDDIDHCNIYDYFLASGTHTGIYIAGACMDWTIDNNRFYQTASRTVTSATASVHSAIRLSSNTINNFQITNNIIGYSSSAGTGTYTITGAVPNEVYAIFVSAHGTTTATTISGNYIQNISQTNSITSAASGGVFFAGIVVSAGIVNVTDNVIGTTSASGSIVLTYAGGNRQATVLGIFNSSGAIGDITGNTISSITMAGNTSNYLTFRGIERDGAIPSTVNVNNNTIGSLTTANSIQASNNSRPYIIHGIYTGTSSSSISVDGNTIANITNNSTNTNSYGTYGIYVASSPSPSVTNNVISALTDNTDAPGYYQTYGIYSASTATGQVYSGNTIFSLVESSTDVGVLTNIYMGAAGTGTISKNRVYGSSVPNATTVGDSEIDGITIAAGSWIVSNNQISLTNGASSFSKGNSGNNLHLNFRKFHNAPKMINAIGDARTNVDLGDDALKIAEINSMQKAPAYYIRNIMVGSDNVTSTTNDVQISGIVDAGAGSDEYYYNSVYVGGSNPGGTLISSCFVRYTTVTVTMKNNLFFNARTGIAGSQLCIANFAGVPATGWAATASNYNVFINSDPTLVGYWTTTCSMDQWRTNSGGEKQTWSADISEISAANLLNSVSTGDLGIQAGNTEAWIVSGKGIAVAGQNTDYSGNTRVTTISGGCTDIGSIEFAATPPGTPTATETGTPGPGATTTYTLWGRVLCTIDWGSGGTYPGGMNFSYFSGVSPQNVAGGNYSNSYSTIDIASGSFSGTTYDITYYFGDNETGSISSPSTNIELAKYDPSAWFPYEQGAGAQQTQVTYNNATETYKALVTGLDGFSSFALTDLTSPLPVDLCQFNAAAKDRDIALYWQTCREINNRGFDVEKRIQTDARTNTFGSWSKITFVAGHGTTNQPQNYSFTDSKLSAGKYQYRLKQTDYNGAVEYYNLQNPNIVEIGIPIKADVSQNYPNPSNPNSKIDYQIPFNGKVSLKVYDIIGREVATIVNEVKTAGFYTANFDGSNLASGVYFYRILAEGDGQKFLQTRKMMLVK